MKSKTRTLLSSALYIGMLTTTATASMLVQEDFTRTDATSVRNTASSPVAGPVNWSGSPGYTAQGNALQSAAVNTGHVLTMDFGAGYFGDNPGIYTLTADVFFATELATSTRNWQIGFNNATNLSAGANRSLASTDAFGGAPGLFLRGDGTAIAKVVNTSNALVTSAGDYPAGSVYNLKLVLNTMGSNWTTDAFIDNVALDLNGADPGTTFTYTTNPTIRYLAIGSNIRDAENTTGLTYLDNLELSVIPEPSSLALLGLAAAFLVARRRKNRQS